MHEEGGDPESDILRDADSIAYFDYNIPGYMKINGEERTKKKIKWMFERMSPEAQEKVKTIKYPDPKINELVKEVLN